VFAGHVGAALALAGAQRRVNAGAFVAAALLSDLLLWTFILLGWESVTIPPDFAASHQAAFVFPWSHGLAASLGWSAAVGAAAFGVTGSRRAALLLAAAVFSHWILDLLVHRPELPLLGADSPHLGLGAWDHLPWALALESGIVLAGLWVFARGAALAQGRSRALVVLVLAILGFTLAGMTVAPPPPSARAMAAGSLATLLALCGAVWWLGRARLVPAAELPDDAAQP
jgi:hypothetical protein